MTKLLKRFVIFLMCFSLVASLFAETASTGVTDSDVKNWTKNIIPMMGELNELGVWDGESISATAKQKASVEGILHKYGISGSNCIDKFVMITNCAVIVITESELDAESIALFKSLGMDPMAELKKNINSKDYAVVESNSKAVIVAYNKIEEYNASSGSAGAVDDYSYGDEELADLYSRLGNAFAQAASEGGYTATNEDTEVIKKLYDQMSKAKGDSGVIYKSKKNGSKYKKTTPKKGCKLAIDYGFDGNEFYWFFDLDAKKAKLDFTWAGKTKTINYTISSVEYYFLKEGSEFGGEGNEYIITTKEGPVFHMFDEWDYSGNAFEKTIGIKGISFESLNDPHAVIWHYEE